MPATLREDQETAKKEIKSKIMIKSKSKKEKELEGE
jgi:hypothetical protein